MEGSKFPGGLRLAEECRPAERNLACEGEANGPPAETRTAQECRKGQSSEKGDGIGGPGLIKGVDTAAESPGGL